MSLWTRLAVPVEEREEFNQMYPGSSTKTIKAVSLEICIFTLCPCQVSLHYVLIHAVQVKTRSVFVLVLHMHNLICVCNSNTCTSTYCTYICMYQYVLLRVSHGKTFLCYNFVDNFSYMVV